MNEELLRIIDYYMNKFEKEGYTNYVILMGDIPCNEDGAWYSAVIYLSQTEFMGFNHNLIANADSSYIGVYININTSISNDIRYREHSYTMEPIYIPYEVTMFTNAVVPEAIDNVAFLEYPKVNGIENMVTTSDLYLTNMILMVTFLITIIRWIFPHNLERKAQK